MRSLRRRLTVFRNDLGRALRAAVGSPSVLVGALFGIGSILLPVYKHLLGQDGSWWRIALLTAGILAGALVLSALLTIRALDPEAYAQLTVAGRSVDEIFEITAVEIGRVCHQFENACKEVDPFSRRFYKALGRRPGFARLNVQLTQLWTDSERQMIAFCLARLRGLRRTQQKPLRRIEVMKRVAAASLRVPPRRLCDQIFQFSPEMYADRFRKYEKNLQELMTLCDAATPDTADRFMALLFQNLGIFRAIKSRRERQRQLRANWDLHSAVRDLASLHSTTAAMKSYSQILCDIGTGGLEEVKGLLTDAGELEKSASRGREALARLADRFFFAYSKQMAHPGYDLHSLLVSACSRLPTELENEKPDANRIVAFLTAIEAASLGFRRDRNRRRERHRASAWRILVDHLVSAEQDLVRKGRDAPPDDLGQLAMEWKKLQRNKELSPSDLRKEAELVLQGTIMYLDRLRALPRLLTRIVANRRREVSSAASALIKRLVADHEIERERLFLVTHGYSKTVRDILLWNKELLESFNLFLLLSGDEDINDTRVMEDELKTSEYGAWPQGIAVGREHVLRGLVGKGDAVLILLGAECFDGQGRVVHARGFADELPKLDRRLRLSRQAKVAVLALAEKHKKVASLTETGFYDDHYDRVDLYHDCDLDGVVSGAEDAQTVAWRIKEATPAHGQ